MNEDTLEVRPKVHPELTELLLNAEESTDIDVVLLLHPDEGKVMDSPKEFKAKCSNLINKVSLIANRLPTKCNPFEYIQTMAVRAKPEYLRILVQQPEIVGIYLSHQ